jgi:predicted dinucleotide-binding enzyme
MKIGIIGAGNIGPTLAQKFVAVGHEVSIANSRGPETLAAIAKETGATPVTIEQVVSDKDMVVIAIPEQSISNLPVGLFSLADAKTIVIDTGNYYPEVRDKSIAEINDGMLESIWVSQQLGVPITKAFNSILVWSLKTGGLPAGTPGRICLPVAGDSSAAKEVVISLIDQIGFDGIDGGKLTDSWRQQPGTPAYCKDLDHTALLTALKEADYSKITEYRHEAITNAKRAVEEAGSLDAATASAGKSK